MLPFFGICFFFMGGHSNFLIFLEGSLVLEVYFFVIIFTFLFVGFVA